MSSRKFINAKRRGFLQGAAVAGGVAASGTALSDVAKEEALAGASKPVTNGKGYELTEHVKKYYKRARF